MERRKTQDCYTKGRESASDCLEFFVRVGTLKEHTNRVILSVEEYNDDIAQAIRIGYEKGIQRALDKYLEIKNKTQNKAHGSKRDNTETKQAINHS